LKLSDKRTHAERAPELIATLFFPAIRSEILFFVIVVFGGKKKIIKRGSRCKHGNRIGCVTLTII
jgi:hypothetical protein